MSSNQPDYSRSSFTYESVIRHCQSRAKEWLPYMLNTDSKFSKGWLTPHSAVLAWVFDLLLTSSFKFPICMAGCKYLSDHKVFKTYVDEFNKSMGKHEKEQQVPVLYVAVSNRQYFAITGEKTLYDAAGCKGVEALNSQPVEVVTYNITAWITPKWYTAANESSSKTPAV